MSSQVDGLDALMEVMTVTQIMEFIEKTSRWVSYETFASLPVWYPEHARKGYFYKNNWTIPRMNKNRQSGKTVHKQEGNTHANEALTRALGLSKSERPNWSCCHIWGGDDLTYQEHNAVVQDSRYFSCVANMVLMPSPLKAFTDVLIEVKTMLRVCAKNTFGWECEHESAASARELVSEFDDWDSYPQSWPKKACDKRPKGTVVFNDKIAASIRRRKSAISSDLRSAGEFYPRDRVEDTLNFWNIDLESQND